MVVQSYDVCSKEYHKVTNTQTSKNLSSMVVNHNGDHEWGWWDQVQGVMQSLVEETDCTQHAMLQRVLKDRLIRHWS